MSFKFDTKPLPGDPKGHILKDLSFSNLASRKFKRAFLPLHRTFKRFVILSGFGILLFLFYVQLLDIYFQKLHRKQKSSNYGEQLEVLSYDKTRNRSRDIYGFHQLFVAPESDNRDTYILILTCSSPWDSEHRNRRAVMRETWADCGSINDDFVAHRNFKPLKQKFCRLVFFTGRTFHQELDERISNEAKQFGDLLVVDILDSYYNITLKLLSAMKWVSTQHVKFLLKTDDDVYVHLPNLYNWLQEERRNLPEDLYCGVLYNGIVVRDPNHKHFVPYTSYPGQRYPLYCKGSMYLLSGHLVPRLLSASERIKRFNIDDAYIGILLNKVKVWPTAMTRFVQFKFMYYAVDLIHYCDLTWVIGIGDSLRPKQVFLLHDRFMKMPGPSYWMCYHVNPAVFLVGILISSLLVIAAMAKNQRE